MNLSKIMTFLLTQLYSTDILFSINTNKMNIYFRDWYLELKVMSFMNNRCYKFVFMTSLCESNSENNSNKTLTKYMFATD